MSENGNQFSLAWSCVDGAGSESLAVEDEQTAIERANEAQANAEKNGNPWGYTYKVRYLCKDSTCTNVVYNARTGERF